jgi:BASS family bile acid:Na+ symporter
MTLNQLIPLVINVSIFLMVFALGLKTGKGDAVYLLQRPWLLVRSLLSMNVIMVAIAAAIVALFDLAPAIGIALVALAVSPVPPILPGKQQKAGGSASYAISLLVVASCAAILFVPVGVSLVGRLFGHDVGVSAGKIARIVLTSVIAPLMLGISVRIFLPAIAERFARPVSLAATAALAIAVLPVLFMASSTIWALVGNGVLLALVAFALIGLAVGHLLAGPNPNDRTVLALATSTRHPGVAVAIANLNFPHETAILAIVLYHLVIGAIVTIPYVKWRRGMQRVELSP